MSLHTPNPAKPIAPLGGSNLLGGDSLLAGNSLLGSIQNSPELAGKLEQMAVDEMTIELSSQIPEEKSQPNFGRRATDRFFTETIEHCDEAVVLDKQSLEQQFIPQREITNIGCERRSNADYRFVGQLGAGGTGVVFQAHQRAVDREVAVKMLRSELASNPHARDRFLAEARVIGGLDHPNVIALHEVYSDETGALFYSMKRVDGTSWDKKIDEQSESQNIEILLRIADGIRYAHSRGLIHRDIKPENVMLGKFGEVLLADWGLAVNHQDKQSIASATNSVGGTPAYMAPELASASASEVTFQTDIYLLGATLYQILTGRPPHDGSTLLQCIQAAASNTIEPSDDDGELMDIALKAMATNPSDRFGDVEGFVAAIKDQHQHEQSSRLIRRAILHVQQAAESEDTGDIYRAFGVADALLGEAIETWPDNEKAIETRKRLQLEYAAIATERGDYELAANIYEAAGEAESDEAVMVQFHRMRRDASQIQVSRYSVLFTQSPDPGLLVKMNSSEIVEANLAFTKTFGYQGDELSGQQIGQLKLWSDLERFNKLMSLAQVDGAVNDFAVRLLHTNGQPIDVIFNARIVEVSGELMLLSTIRRI